MEDKLTQTEIVDLILKTKSKDLIEKYANVVSDANIIQSLIVQKPEASFEALCIVLAHLKEKHVYDKHNKSDDLIYTNMINSIYTHGNMSSDNIKSYLYKVLDWMKNSDDEEVNVTSVYKIDAFKANELVIGGIALNILSDQDDFLTILEYCSSYNVCKYILTNPSITTAVLEKIIHIYKPEKTNCGFQYKEILDLILKSEAINEDLVLLILKSSTNHFSTISSVINTPDLIKYNRVALFLYTHPNYLIRKEFASNCKDNKLLDILSKDNDIFVVRTVAQNKETSLETLRFLSKHKDNTVKRLVRENKNFVEELSPRDKILKNIGDVGITDAYTDKIHEEMLNGNLDIKGFTKTIESMNEELQKGNLDIKGFTKTFENMKKDLQLPNNTEQQEPSILKHDTYFQEGDEEDDLKRSSEHLARSMLDVMEANKEKKLIDEFNKSFEVIVNSKESLDSGILTNLYTLLKTNASLIKGSEIEKYSFILSHESTPYTVFLDFVEKDNFHLCYNSILEKALVIQDQVILNKMLCNLQKQVVKKTPLTESYNSMINKIVKIQNDKKSFDKVISDVKTQVIESLKSSSSNPVDANHTATNASASIQPVPEAIIGGNYKVISIYKNGSVCVNKSYDFVHIINIPNEEAAFKFVENHHRPIQWNNEFWKETFLNFINTVVVLEFNPQLLDDMYKYVSKKKEFELIAFQIEQYFLSKDYKYNLKEKSENDNMNVIADEMFKKHFDNNSKKESVNLNSYKKPDAKSVMDFKEKLERISDSVIYAPIDINREIIINELAQDSLKKENKWKNELTSAGYRVITKQMFDFVRTALISLLEKQGQTRESLNKFAILLDSEFGKALLSSVIGNALTHTNTFSDNKHVQLIANELRIDGMSIIGNEIFDKLKETLFPVITESLSSITEEEQESFQEEEEREEVHQVNNSLLN